MQCLLTSNVLNKHVLQAREDSRAVYPAPTVRTEVTVILMDVNDETPTFRSKSYACEVNENAPSNTPLTFLGHAVPQVFDYDQVSLSFEQST